jgi:hypothetical protein
MSIPTQGGSCDYEKPLEQRASSAGEAETNGESEMLMSVLPVEPLSGAGNGRPRPRIETAPAAAAPWERRMVLIAGAAGLFLLTAVSLTAAGLWYSWGREEANWTVLFRSDDPSVWDTDSPGKKYAIPLKQAPAKFRYLRLRRMDTGESLILPLTSAELRNGKAPSAEAGSWWNGTAKLDWEGRHLGIAQAPRHKFPAHKGMIGVMADGWDVFTGSGFGHKSFANDKQYYCWRGKEIPKTVFEISVTDGPLTAEEKRCLLDKP